jgi:hypothetical protein
MSPGVLSAGIGEVPSEQTFLDASQGNRIDEALYDRSLPGLHQFARRVPGWPGVVERAEDAPADLIPGSLAHRLRAAGLAASAEQPLRAPALVAVDPRGLVFASRPGECVRRRCPGLAVVYANVEELAGLTGRLRGNDLVIALTAPPPGENEPLPIGISGRGFDGDLTSDSTRTDGYVLSTDLAPTILERFELDLPDEMDGEPIRSDRESDPGGIEDRALRMEAIPERRTPVVVGCLVLWTALAAVAMAMPEMRRSALAWLGVAFAYMPLLLLLGAALEPTGFVECLIVGVGAAALAAVTVRLLPGWTALAFACGVTVLAYAIDVLAGSDLTALSLLGPNPVFGVRFYGIGNELEALFAVMVPAGVGAALSALAASGRPVSKRGAIGAFLGTAGLAAGVFAAGRFGADVGAAIVLPVGAAVAAVVVPAGTSSPSGSTATNRRGRIVGALIAAPIAGLLLLAFIDLISEGGSHLTRSVLDAGGARELGDVAQRRLMLSADDFAEAAGNPLFWLVVAGIAVALAQWRHIDTWLEPAPMARAGLIGASAAVAVGVLTNDSGASFLALGALALGAFLAFSWAQRAASRRGSRPEGNPNLPIG